MFRETISVYFNSRAKQKAFHRGVNAGATSCCRCTLRG